MYRYKIVVNHDLTCQPMVRSWWLPFWRKPTPAWPTYDEAFEALRVLYGKDLRFDQVYMDWSLAPKLRKEDL